MQRVFLVFRTYQLHLGVCKSYMYIRQMDLISLILILIWTVICSKTTSAQPPAYSAASLSPAQIEMYLEKYLKNHEIFPGSLLADDLPSTRQTFYDRYTDGVTVSKNSNPMSTIILKDIVEAYSIVEKDVAVIKNLQDCSITDHQSLQYLNIFDEYSTDQERLATFRALIPGFLPPTKYCNFFNYLTCQPHPASATGHKCMCASSDLVAEVDPSTGDEKCVFKILAKCRNRPDQKLGNMFFVKFNFVEEFFDKELEDKCEKQVVCDHDDHTCDDPMSMYYFRSLEDIAKVLLQHLDDAGVTDSRRAEAMRVGMDQVRQMHYDISLQVSIEERLAGFKDLPCDSAVDSQLRKMLRDYHFGGSSWATPMDASTARSDYGKMVVGMDIQQTVCNHFRLLHCETDMASPNFDKCVCNEDLEWNPTEKRCSITVDLATCSKGRTNSKREFLFQVSASGVSPVTVTFYQEIDQLECGPDSICSTMGPKQICFTEAESPEVKKLQEDFENKFVLDLDARCDLPQHQTLLGTGAPDYTTRTLRERRAMIQALVDDPTIKYCRVKNYQTCDPNTSTCKCFTKSDVDDQKCIAFLFDQCGQVRSSIHDKFDDLTLIPVALRPPIDETIGCMQQFSSCLPHADPALMGNVCQCNNLVGPLCNVPVNHHAAFLKIENLDPSMKTAEGYRVLDGLKEKLNTLEKMMNIPYGGLCDNALNNQLNVILDYLREARECCTFSFHGWSCQKPSDTPPCPTSNLLDLTEFELTFKRVKDLINTGGRFCSRADGVDCVMGKCECKPDSFFQMGQCALEIAEVCSPDRPSDDPFYPPCRDGLECDLKTRTCIISNSAACTVAVASGSMPITIEDSQKQQLQCLKTLISGLDSLRRKGNGNACNWQQERQLQLALNKADALSDLNKFSGSVDDRRQHIRLLQPISQELDNRNDVLYCSLETPCSQENEICTDGVDMFGEKKSSRANVSASSQFLLIVYLLGAVAVSTLL